MNEEDARSLMLVRAVEMEDTAEAILTREDRLQGTSIGRAALSRMNNQKRRKLADEAFLVARSRFALDRLETRFPAVAKASRTAKWPRWVDWALPLAALLIGLATNQIDSGQRLNIIAFPLVGMIIWNLAVYGFLVLNLARGLLRPRSTHGGSHPLNRLAHFVGARFGHHLEAQPALVRALSRFSHDWVRASSKLTYSRTSRTLHLSAAALAVGVILGMYLRALGLEYRAGWESTFIGAPTLRWWLLLVLGPASALTGIPLPDTAHLQSLRWSNGNGEIAGPWIHLYAVTAVAFIVAPRLVLSATSAATAFRLKSRFAVPGDEDFYIRRLLRSAKGLGSTVRIIPYSFHPPAAMLQGLGAMLSDVLGDGTQVITDTPIPYGGEDDWLAQTHLNGDEDHLLVLFNLAATPEVENHGTLVAGIRNHLTDTRSGTALSVLLDESSYRSRLAGQAGAEERIEARRQAWRKILTDQGVEPFPFDLADDAANLAARLEGSLILGPLVPDTGTGL